MSKLRAGQNTGHGGTGDLARDRQARNTDLGQTRESISNLDEVIRTHLADQIEERFVLSRKFFEQTGFGLSSYLLPDSVKKLLTDEIIDLVETCSMRRDMQLAETSNTHRKMRNVTAAKICERDGWIKAVYESPAFREALSWVAGEPVLICPYLPEQYIITRLESTGDTHGWHWDDYSFGVIFVVECPPLNSGGFVQTVSGTLWDKKNPQVFLKMIDNPIRSHELKPGDIYLLRTDTTLHQVHPILNGRRTIVNMAYAANRDMDKRISHETMEELFRT